MNGQQGGKIELRPVRASERGRLVGRKVRFSMYAESFTLNEVETPNLQPASGVKCPGTPCHYVHKYPCINLLCTLIRKGCLVNTTLHLCCYPCFAFLKSDYQILYSNIALSGSVSSKICDLSNKTTFLIPFGGSYGAYLPPLVPELYS